MVQNFTARLLQQESWGLGMSLISFEADVRCLGCLETTLADLCAPQSGIIRLQMSYTQFGWFSSRRDRLKNGQSGLAFLPGYAALESLSSVAALASRLLSSPSGEELVLSRLHDLSDIPQCASCRHSYDCWGMIVSKLHPEEHW